jgi:hypothetical protein
MLKVLVIFVGLGPWLVGEIWARCEVIPQGSSQSAIVRLKSFGKAFATGRKLPQNYLHPLVAQRDFLPNLVTGTFRKFHWKQNQNQLQVLLSEAFLLEGDGSLEWSKRGESCGGKWRIYPVYGQKKLLAGLFQVVDQQGQQFFMPTLWAGSPFGLVYHAVNRWSYGQLNPNVIREKLKAPQTDLTQYLLVKSLEAFQRSSPYFQWNDLTFSSHNPFLEGLQKFVPEGRVLDFGVEFDNRILASLTVMLPPRRVSLDQLYVGELILGTEEMISRCQQMARFLLSEDPDVSRSFPQGLRCHYHVQDAELPPKIKEKYTSAILVRWNHG